VRLRLWTGDKLRPLNFYSPCPCGCDSRTGPNLGYLSASDHDGHGFSMIAESDTEARHMRALAKGSLREEIYAPPA